MKTIKLFGFYLLANQDDDQDTITTNDEASRKRKFSPNQEEDDDHNSFIPKKPKLCDDGEEGEDAVPPSDDGDDEDAVPPISAFFPEEVTTDDAILGKREVSFNQEVDDDDSFIPKKPKLLRLIGDGKLAMGSPNPEEAVPPRMFKLFGVYISIDQDDQALIQNPNKDDQATIQNPNQEEEEEEEEEAAPDPPEGNDLVFMFEKELTSTDVARNHNRLLITKRTSLRLMAALTEEERKRVEVIGGDDNLRVVTTDPNGVEYILKLKRWAGSGALVLKHEWGKLVRANGLQMGDSVVGWGYRVDDEFRFFLDIIKNQFN